MRREVQRLPPLRTINDPCGRQSVHSGLQLRVRVLGPLAAAEGQKRLPGACEAFLFFSYILSEFLKKLVAPQLSVGLCVIMKSKKQLYQRFILKIT